MILPKDNSSTSRGDIQSTVHFAFCLLGLDCSEDIRRGKGSGGKEPEDSYFDGAFWNHIVVFDPHTPETWAFLLYHCIKSPLDSQPFNPSFSKDMIGSFHPKKPLFKPKFPELPGDLCYRTASKDPLSFFASSAYQGLPETRQHYNLEE